MSAGNRLNGGTQSPRMGLRYVPGNPDKQIKSCNIFRLSFLYGIFRIRKKYIEKSVANNSTISLRNQYFLGRLNQEAYVLHHNPNSHICIVSIN